MGAQSRTIVAVGDRIIHKTYPPISRHTLALYCGASGDHNPMHVDIDFAKKAGFPDVFSQGMLVMGYLGQALTDAVKPDAIRSFSTRFSAITQLGADSPARARWPKCSKPAARSARGSN